MIERNLWFFEGHLGVNWTIYDAMVTPIKNDMWHKNLNLNGKRKNIDTSVQGKVVPAQD